MRLGNTSTVLKLAEALDAPRVHMNRDASLDAEMSPVIGWTPEL